MENEKTDFEIIKDFIDDYGSETFVKFLDKYYELDDMVEELEQSKKDLHSDEFDEDISSMESYIREVDNGVLLTYLFQVYPILEGYTSKDYLDALDNNFNVIKLSGEEANRILDKDKDDYFITAQYNEYKAFANFLQEFYKMSPEEAREAVDSIENDYDYEDEDSQEDTYEDTSDNYWGW